MKYNTMVPINITRDHFLIGWCSSSLYEGRQTRFTEAFCILYFENLQNILNKNQTNFVFLKEIILIRLYWVQKLLVYCNYI